MLKRAPATVAERTCRGMVRGSRLSAMRAGVRAQDGNCDSSHEIIVIDVKNKCNNEVPL